MRPGWQRTTLGEALQVTETVDPLRAPDSEFEYIDVSSVSNETFQIESTQRLKGKDAPSRARRKVKANDVLFATVRPTLRRIAIVPKNLHNQVCSTGYFVLRPKPLVDYGFLFYFLFTADFSNRMEQLQKGASYPAVTDRDIRTQPFAFPPLPEQQRIVAILDESFAAVATAKANTEKSLLNARALFESHLQSVFSRRGEGWTMKTMGDETLLEIIDGDRGANYPKAADFHDEGHCLFLNTKNVRPNGFEFESTMFITETKDRQLRKGKLRRDDVVLTTRGTIGNIGLYSEDVPYDHVRINSGMLILRANKRTLLPQFLFELLRSEIVKDQFAKQSTGAAQPQLPVKTLVNLTIPVPQKVEDQAALVEKLRTFYPETQSLENIHQQKLAALDELKKALLHEAFKGAL